MLSQKHICSHRLCRVYQLLTVGATICNLYVKLSLSICVLCVSFIIVIQQVFMRKGKLGNVGKGISKKNKDKKEYFLSLSLEKKGNNT